MIEFKYFVIAIMTFLLIASILIILVHYKSYEKGYEQALKEIGVIHGKDAEQLDNFMENNNKKIHESGIKNKRLNASHCKKHGGYGFVQDCVECKKQ